MTAGDRVRVIAPYLPSFYGRLGTIQATERDTSLEHYVLIDGHEHPQWFEDIELRSAPK